MTLMRKLMKAKYHKTIVMVSEIQSRAWEKHPC